MKDWNEKDIVEQLHNLKTRNQAFTMVVNRYKEPLYWQIRRMVLVHDDADDVLQNTFMKAWAALDNFRGDAQISTWLYRIANNETLNFLARKKMEMSLDEDAAQSIASHLMADPYFDGDETAAQLQAAIAQLPERQRQVFNMKYFEEMKYEEISEVLHVSTGALKASFFHAVKKISEYFNKED